MTEWKTFSRQGKTSGRLHHTSFFEKDIFEIGLVPTANAN